MMLKLSFAALLVAMLAALLSELGFRQKKLFVTLSLVVIFSLLADALGQILSSVTNVASLEGISDCAKSAIKAVGVGYVLGFASDICDELGEKGLSSAVSIAARIEIFLIALPYFEKVIRLGVDFIK